MGSGGSASAGLFLALNLLLFFFTLAGSCSTYPPEQWPTPTPTSSSDKRCPIDALRMASCSNLLNGLIGFGIGRFPQQPCDCCTLMAGMLDLEAAFCLCTVLRTNILGMHFTVPIHLTLLLNYCGKSVPPEFQCP